MNYSDFKQVLDDTLFTDAKVTLLKNLKKNPSRFVGIFRASTPKGKLIQNFTQSLEIKYGDALESVFREMFSDYGLEKLPQDYKNPKNGKDLNVDQVFKYGNNVIFIEQKIRDDHDSTKKSGQFTNFKDKYNVLKDYYRGYKIIGSMWFIDDSLVKNKKYYITELEKLEKSDDEFCLAYGGEIFKFLANELDINELPDMWYEICKYLELWKKDIPDLPELNFDKDPEETMRAFKTIIEEESISFLSKLFENDKVVDYIFPIIFPEKKSLLLLKQFINAQIEEYDFTSRKMKNYEKINENLGKIIK
ncbi:HpyAIV family type II restriction enzyme [Staphylococcus cohnii]|uniref:HpyAIV family type II restriction enzyme n=1 Tax=Staphylococcus cohnii TaxID=29382 RepID=UPI002BEDF9BB|nr:hypothetical protein [Pseudogracilibacillus sp.]